VSEIEDSVSAFIRDDLLHGRDEVLLEATTPLLEEGLIDSMGLQRLVAFLEEEFDLTVPDDLLAPEHFENVRSIGALVSGLRGGS
jgi:clorobiocin biosynthesis protein CloN5